MKHYFNEEGVKYSLAKLYQRPNLDFNYYEILNHVPIAHVVFGAYNFYAHQTVCLGRFGQ